MPSAESPIAVRDAEARDREAMRDLLDELGYPSDTQALDRRLGRIEAEPSVTVVVAEWDGSLVGIASLHVLHLIERIEEEALKPHRSLEKGAPRESPGTAGVLCTA